MIVLGLFHGLLFLPVLLSLLGPDPYHGVNQTADPEDPEPGLTLNPESLTEKQLSCGRESAIL
jgi:hypothetical protein